ncbi:MAG: ribonuclease Y [Candidatus Firestonebacteria bacterium RIFOXYA2_FULL_40_8]|nr:MAG: ribonuclease Y [Candidatus Firestonebacteria bacterium RIFOXYA2_FULL_40_8]
MNITTVLIIVFVFIVAAILGVAVGWMVRKKTSEDKIASAEQIAKKLLADAEKQVESKKKEAIIEAKEELYKAKQQFESETKERRIEIQNLEKRLVQKEEHVDKKVDLLDQKEKENKARENELIQKDKLFKDKDDKLNRMIEDERVKLEKISGLTTESAKKMLLEMLEKQAHHDAAAIIKRIEDEAKEEAEKKAKKIISLAIQRCSIDHTVESTVSVVPLPNEEMKGRVIGREGRNIRALEAATGIDVIVDDTPEAVVLSGFDMVRREIARISLERLISDGRIHPTRIEEVVERVKSEVEEKIKETGERTVLDMGLSGIHPELVRLIGRLKYRTSYGQNILQHSIEVANMAGMLAGELGLDTVMFKRAGLLHDIGKAVDHEIEGTHPQIGADLVKKYKESPRVISAVGDHHGDDQLRTIDAIIVQAADSISGARPGARRESLETYIKRLEKLENIAESFTGVKKSFAIQAGREIRIMVEHTEINDSQALQIAKDIAKRIEEEVEYPGQVKVTVIREMRASEYAK